MNFMPFFIQKAVTLQTYCGTIIVCNFTILFKNRQVQQVQLHCATQISCTFVLIFCTEYLGQYFVIILQEINQRECQTLWKADRQT